MPFCEQLFGLGLQDPGSQSPDPSKLAQDPKEKDLDCPGCLELVVWQMASKKAFTRCYDEGNEGEGWAAASSSSLAVAAASPSSAGDESSLVLFVTPVLVRFVPKQQHLACCLKKPVLNSRSQNSSGSWSNWSSGYHDR